MSKPRPDNQIKRVIENVFSIEYIRTRDDLHNWCEGSSLDKLYKYVEAFAPAHWSRIQNPKASVRFYSQRMLAGYHISRH